MSEDAFGTAALREQVLATWTASPDRFREDANAEEDLALGGYRDRLVVELAQNAADAAGRAGVPGRLLLRLAATGDGWLLVAANTGAPLDAAGVRALATLRASAKREPDHAATVGRFGVGFAAVLAVTDEPAVVSHGRGVRFSRGDTLALVRQAAASTPRLAEELERRDDHVPVLRLPFPADGVAPTGYDTAVLLPLRDGSATDLVEHLLSAVDDALLLALPGLAEVVLEQPDRPQSVLSDVEARWHRIRREGTHAPATLADRPTEERARTGWSLTWALPREGLLDREAPAVPRVLHAPTPTDEPLDWPALLVATFPLDVTRRHVAPGPATAALVAEAAGAYADLLSARAVAGDDVLPLVPTGLPAGRLDAVLRSAVLALLPDVRLLPAVEDGTLLRPRDAVALDGAAGNDTDALAVLAPAVAGLVAAPRRATAGLGALGVRRMTLADVVEELPAGADPSLWAYRYAGLARLAVDAASREALAALPVPLGDGRVVRGVRGAYLVDGPAAGQVGALAQFGLRLVHPDAAATPQAVALLERLGASRATPRTLLDDPAVRAAVEHAAEEPEDADAADVATAVLHLVRAAVEAGELSAGDVAWLGDLPLPAADGDPAPASALVLPGSTAAELLDAGEVLEVAAEAVEEWGDEVLEVVGVARSLAVVRATDVDTRDLPEELDELDGAGEWASALPRGVVAEVSALRDLDLVGDGRWHAALACIAADPALRDAVTTPAVVRAPDGRAHREPSYAAWWLRRRLRLSGAADPGADPPLAALLPAAPEEVASADPGLRRALGLVRAWADLDGEGWDAVLRAVVERDASLPEVLAMWAALAAAAAGEDPPDLQPPERLRVPGAGGDTVVVASEDAVVVDAPMWAQRDDLGGLVPAGGAPAAEALADVLDLDLACERAPGQVTGTGQAAAVPDAALLLLPEGPRTWREHDDLAIDGHDVDWWVSGHGPDAVVHAVTLSGLARGLAQAAGCWPRRFAIEAVLLDPGSVAAVLLEEALGA